jgi:hypothetical protein
MHRVTSGVDAGRRGNRRRRALGIAVLSAAVVAVMVDPGPAQAATIPTPPAACKTPTPTPGVPLMTSFARTPTGVNVTAGPKKVTFTVKAKDSTRNITSIGVSMQSPKISGVQRGSFAFLKRTSGTAKNGTWKGTATIPRWTNNGTWKITQVFLFDAGNGFNFYIPTGGGSRPWNNAWPKAFSVKSTPDVKPPTVSSLKLSTGSVDTSSKPRPITVTVKAKDNLSGISGLGVGASVTIGSRNFNTGTFLVRKAGTARNGTFKGTMIVPRWVMAGTHVWKLTLSAGDVAGNFLGLSAAQLKAKHLTSTFKVKSKTDSTKPALKGLTYTPKSVDARAKSKTVAVTLKASDTLSGVSSARVTFTSPSGFPSTGFLVRKSGTPGSGTWKGKVVIPRCSEPGIWKVSVGLTDVAGNSSRYTTAQVKAKHFSTTLTVKALDIQAPTASVPATVPHANPVVVTFSEPTLWQGSSNTFSVQDEGTFSTVGGTWTCKNASGTAVGCNNNGANVKTASFAPTSSFTAGHKYNVSGSGIFDTSGNGPTFVFSQFKAT